MSNWTEWLRKQTDNVVGNIAAAVLIALAVVIVGALKAMPGAVIASLAIGVGAVGLWGLTLIRLRHSGRRVEERLSSLERSTLTIEGYASHLRENFDTRVKELERQTATSSALEQQLARLDAR